MNKKLIASLIVLLGLVAVVFVFDLDQSAGAMLIKKHVMGKYAAAKLHDYHCPPLPSYDEMCVTEWNGHVCKPDHWGYSQCCHTAADCVEMTFIGHTFNHCVFGSNINVGACPHD